MQSETAPGPRGPTTHRWATSTRRVTALPGREVLRPRSRGRSGSCPDVDARPGGPRSAQRSLCPIHRTARGPRGGLRQTLRPRHKQVLAMRPFTACCILTIDQSVNEPPCSPGKGCVGAGHGRRAPRFRMTGGGLRHGTWFWYQPRPLVRGTPRGAAWWSRGSFPIRALGMGARPPQGGVQPEPHTQS